MQAPLTVNEMNLEPKEIAKKIEGTALGEYVGRPVAVGRPITPWQESRLNKCLGFLHFLFGICLLISKIMLGIFMIFFTYHFLHQLWDLCERVLFTGNW